MIRRVARESALEVLFERSFHKEEPLEDIIILAAENRELKQNNFSKSLIEGVEAHREELDELIEKHLVQWKLQRISRIALSILRLALFELTYMRETPESVCINEAVELAKKFSDENDAAFINGLLGSVVRSRKETQPQEREETVESP